jgi:hypothetical protein
MAQYLGRGNQPILRGDAAARHAGAEEQTFRHFSLVHVHKSSRHLFRLEGGTAKVSTCAEWTVIAIALACRSQQGLEQRDALAAWHDGAMDAQRVLLGFE